MREMEVTLADGREAIIKGTLCRAEPDVGLMSDYVDGLVVEDVDGNEIEGLSDSELEVLAEYLLAR